MKKVLLLTLALTTSLFISCSSDDDNTPAPETGTDANIVGTWTAESVDYSGFTSTLVLDTGNTLRVEYTGTGTDIDFGMVFSESPNELVTSGSFDLDLTTSIQGIPEQSMVLDLDFLENGTWVRNGNTLRLTTADSEVIEISIELLTENSLRLRLTEESSISTDEIEEEELLVTVVTLSR